jgi:molybdate transport system ATP-binding protein
MQNENSRLIVEQLSVRRNGRLILDGIDFSVAAGEHLAIVGRTGSGKTTLIEALAGMNFHHGQVRFFGQGQHPPRIRVISRQHRFTNLSNINSFYYQQRFNSFDAEDARSVTEELGASGPDHTRVQEVLEQVGMGHLANTRLIQLSNGEHKRFQLAEALLTGADWLLLDCPYTGLDKAARAMLSDILDRLVQAGTEILLVTTPDDIPERVTHVAVLENGKLQQPMPRVEFLHRHHKTPAASPSIPTADRLVNIPAAYPDPPFTLAVKMVNVTIRYDARTILDDINWEVRRGECWQLSGPNGSGKSTLLSLINGDNPQAFSQEIYLFDRRKGSGESIWDIKRRIGYVSPELHHYFEGGIRASDLVASGLFDTMGLFRQPNDFQLGLVSQWMELLHINHLAQRYFHGLSDGEQRLVLLARALVKNPPMLILDEPCQGLDDTETKAFTALVDAICRSLHKTLIYVSHYDADLPSCITKRLALNQGKVQSITPTDSQSF